MSFLGIWALMAMTISLRCCVRCCLRAQISSERNVPRGRDIHVAEPLRRNEQGHSRVTDSKLKTDYVKRDVSLLVHTQLQVLYSCTLFETNMRISRVRFRFAVVSGRPFGAKLFIGSVTKAKTRTWMALALYRSGASFSVLPANSKHAFYARFSGLMCFLTTKTASFL